MFPRFGARFRRPSSRSGGTKSNDSRESFYRGGRKKERKSVVKLEDEITTDDLKKRNGLAAARQSGEEIGRRVTSRSWTCVIALTRFTRAQNAIAGHLRLLDNENNASSAPVFIILRGNYINHRVSSNVMRYCFPTTCLHHSISARSLPVTSLNHIIDLYLRGNRTSSRQT